MRKKANPKKSPAPPRTEDEALGKLLQQRLRKEKPLDLDEVLKADYGKTLEEF